MRLICIAMDEGKCVVCNTYDTSNDAHHLFYRRGWENTKPEDLLTLCRKCHDEVHDLGREVTEATLWMQYQNLYKEALTGCFVCHSEYQTIPFNIEGKQPHSLEMCQECAGLVQAEVAKDGCHPWKYIRLMKERIRVSNVRNFHAKNLKEMLSIGLNEKYNRDFFRIALSRAGEKIRIFLLTQSV